MSDELARLKLQGVYPQAQPGLHMVRVKVPGGRLSPDQAEGLAGLAERHAGARLHLTTRMSIEFHDVCLADLPRIQGELQVLGLTSRGACGGAVRGVAVSTPSGPGATESRALAVSIQEHFTGNPRFEGLPKKFKVGVDAGYAGARHLIQDAGFVWVGRSAGGEVFDVWLAGGLGRAPRAAFPFAKAVPARAAIPLLEAVLELYETHAAKGKRLKHVAEANGEEWLRAQLAKRLEGVGLVASAPVEPQASGAGDLLLVPVFAGDLASSRLLELAGIARSQIEPVLVLTADQDLGFPVSSAAERACLADTLGLSDDSVPVAFRVCPGSHECKMGLARTRDLAREILATARGAAARSWAISGCPNSCAQPQLADVGIVCQRLQKLADGSRGPRFQLLAGISGALGRVIGDDLDHPELMAALGRKFS